MTITFDTKKDAANKKKHRLSLNRALDFNFESALFLIDTRVDYGEVRIRALGFLDGRLHSLIFAQNGEEIRAISLRKATRYEEKEFAEST